MFILDGLVNIVKYNNGSLHDDITLQSTYFIQYVCELRWITNQRLQMPYLVSKTIHHRICVWRELALITFAPQLVWSSNTETTDTACILIRLKVYTLDLDNSTKSSSTFQWSITSYYHSLMKQFNTFLLGISLSR